MLPKVRLFTQYLQNPFLVSFFDWHSSNINALVTKLTGLKIDSYTHLTGYLLQLYIPFAFGLPSLPLTTPESMRYDSGYSYDTDSIYDGVDDPLYIKDELLKKFVFWHVRQDLKENNIYNLYRRIKDFCDVSYSEIEIIEDNPNIFRIILPEKEETRFLQKLLFTKKITVAYGIRARIEIL